MTAPTQVTSSRTLDMFYGDVVGAVHRANGTPTNGTSGTLANVAKPGDLLLTNDGGTVALYQNTNTQASPTWTKIEAAGGAGAFTTLSASSTVSGAGFNALFASPPAIGGTTPAAGAFSSTITAPTAAGATITLTAANSGQAILLNQASGSTVTLPAATGSGARFRFITTVTLTSAANKILAASSSDNLIGIVTGENAGTAKVFASASGTGNHSLQMPFAGTQPSGGFQGDWLELDDVAANLWEVKGAYQAGTTPTTPFSTATS